MDEHGLRFVRDLSTVFRDVWIVALASSDRVRRQAVKGGATAARPRTIAPAKLAELVARLALRPAGGSPLS